MRRTVAVMGALALAWVAALASRAEDSPEARAIVEQAIKASGGAEELAKYKAGTSKMKGTVHVMGMGLPFNADIATDGAERQRFVLEFELDGMKFMLTQVFNRDKGWIKLNDMISEMDNDKLTEVQHAAYEQWLMTLVPLKDKAFALTLIGESKVDETPAVAVKVSHKNRRDITMHFDKKSHLLLKTETRVKDDMSGQEMTQESFLSGYADKGPKLPLKLTVKRDGKVFVEAEFSDIKAEEKLDDSLFQKP